MKLSVVYRITSKIQYGSENSFGGETFGIENTRKIKTTLEVLCDGEFMLFPTDLESSNITEAISSRDDLHCARVHSPFHDYLA